jgi:hypothetical protein
MIEGEIVDEREPSGRLSGTIRSTGRIDEGREQNGRSRQPNVIGKRTVFVMVKIIFLPCRGSLGEAHYAKEVGSIRCGGEAREPLDISYQVLVGIETWNAAVAFERQDCRLIFINTAQRSSRKHQ